jgi:hypothetical protein
MRAAEVETRESSRWWKTAGELTGPLHLGDRDVAWGYWQAIEIEVSEGT